MANLFQAGQHLCRCGLVLLLLVSPLVSPPAGAQGISNSQPGSLTRSAPLIAPDLTRTIRSALFEEEALDLGRAQLLKELRALRDKAATAPAGCTALLLLLANP